MLKNTANKCKYWQLFNLHKKRLWKMKVWIKSQMSQVTNYRQKIQFLSPQKSLKKKRKIMLSTFPIIYSHSLNSQYSHMVLTGDRYMNLFVLSL